MLSLQQGKIKILLFCDYKKRVKVRLFTDSKATLESIASSKQIDRKTLRLTVVDLKERLVDGEILLYLWLPKQKMGADVMTKEMKIPPALEDVITKNVMDHPQPLVIEVKAVGSEICMTNIRNR